MTAIVPQFAALSEAVVRRLVDDLMADLEAIPDHRDRRSRVYPLSGLLTIRLSAGIDVGQGLEDAADFARNHAAGCVGWGSWGTVSPTRRPCCGWSGGWRRRAGRTKPRSPRWTRTRSC